MVMPVDGTMTVLDVMIRCEPAERWASRVRHLVPPDDLGDRLWSLVMDEIRASPGYADLVTLLRTSGWPQRVRLGQGRVLDGNRLLVAAVQSGDTDTVPVTWDVPLPVA